MTTRSEGRITVHCPTCRCAPGMTDEQLDELIEQERRGLQPDHEHCPDCGCDPQDHTMHAEGCRRIGQLDSLQCGPPWMPWPADVT